MATQKMKITISMAVGYLKIIVNNKWSKEERYKRMKAAITLLRGKIDELESQIEKYKTKTNS